ncbi:MAG: enoyl-CoA hydratase/isomerase family protein, partial [Actinomycetia bacterium]|nr:enoyl-CoA hydratase/isomerase family protein [Actinomycetes bacterium]
MSTPVRYENEDGIAWVTIDRPEARNALNAATREGLWDATHRFIADDDALVMILTAVGDKAFCAGADLAEMVATSLEVPPADFIPHFGRNVQMVKPTIAAVNGAAYAGGFLLAQMCDLCIAADHARFAVTEAKVGRGSPWAVPLPALIPPRVALEILMTGEPVDAQRAYELGLVNRVVPKEELRAAALEMAQTLASNAPLSVRAAKATVALATEMPLSEAFAAADEIW